jgi:hypothetical protein
VNGQAQSGEVLFSFPVFLHYPWCPPFSSDKPFALKDCS